MVRTGTKMVTPKRQRKGINEKNVIRKSNQNFSESIIDWVEGDRAIEDFWVPVLVWFF